MKVGIAPILHVGRFARVVHSADSYNRTPSATHVVTTYLGLSVTYWRRYRQGWTGVKMGPEWWE